MNTGSLKNLHESKKKKPKTLITSSGRTSKTPKHLLTTTDEEVPPTKKNKPQMTIAQHKEHLRNMLKSMKQSTQKVDKTKKNNENVSPNRTSLKAKSEKNTLMNNTKNRDDESAVRRTLLQKIESESRANIQKSNAEQSISNSCSSIDPIEVLDSRELIVPAKNTGKKLAKFSVDPPVQKNSVNTPKLPAFDHAGIAQPNVIADRERHNNEELNTSSHHLNKSPKMSEFETLIKDLTKECEKMKQHNNDIEQQNAEIKQQNIAIKEQFKEIIQLMSDVRSHISNAGVDAANLSDKLFEPLEGFPLQSKEQFDVLNSSRRQRKILYHYLRSRGGTKIREFLSIAMKITMTDELVSQFTWLGNERDAKFGDTRVSNVFYVAARNCPFFVGPQDKNVYKTEMLEVLRSTKQRYRNSKKKSMNKETPSKSNNLDDEKQTAESDEEQNGDNELSAQDIARELERLNDLEESETEGDFDAESGDEFGDDEDN